MPPSTTSTSASTSAAPSDAYRLPRTVEPLTYRLTLEPDLEAARFTGSVEIDVEVLGTPEAVVLNAAELELHDVELAPKSGQVLSGTADLDPDQERATLRFGGPLPTGPATLRIAFAGVLNDKLRGFYRSTFTDTEGRTRTIATTQMESTDARRAFPCWDEPDRKATFEVTLVVDRDLAAFSNSPIVGEENVGDGRRRVRFGATMKMSTYLVAFVVGPLQATAPVDAGGVPVRVVHAPGKGSLTTYALDVATHALGFFTDYFGIPYPADKLDLVAIPDFAFGAMENLGCVTFRETALLIDPAQAARTELERVADVVCHEIAHMWFGDLVTMRWWEGIWLNEAFATFLEVLAVDAFRPAWQRWVSFGLEREAALAVDGLHATRPIEYPVGSPEEADGMFDVLTYQKGGSVLRMLEQYLGAEVFRDGVRRYLTTHAYGNTVTGDLWQALEDVSGEPVRSVMDSWILQGGYPLVAISADALVQQPFAYRPGVEGAEGASGEGSAIGKEWQVPVLVRVARAADAADAADAAGGGGHGGQQGGGPLKMLLGPAPEPLRTVAPEIGSVVVNAGGWGVYRVGYPAEHLAALAGRLDDLDALERFNLFSDAWALALAGRAELDGLLSLARRLGDEEDPATFSVVAAAFGLFDRVVADDDRRTVQLASQALLGPRAATLGWERRAGEGERVPTLRALLLGELGTVGADPAVREEASRRFDAARSGSGPAVDPDLEGAVLRSVAAQLRDGDYEAMLERYRHPSTPQEELRYLMALAAFPDTELSVRTFELALTEVRTQNAPYLVGALLGNRVGGPAVWERVKSEWARLLDRFPVNSHSRMLDGCRGLCGNAALATDVTEFLHGHPLATGQRSVAQMLERLAVSVAFGGRWRDRLGAVLAGAASETSGPTS